MIGSRCVAQPHVAQPDVAQPPSAVRTRCGRSLFVLFLLTVFLHALPAAAQETVFNVPSGDVLDRGKAYFEFDATYMPSTAVSSLTPRIVVGVGHRIEAGLNVDGISTPGVVQTTLAPTIQWKAYDGGNNGWALLLGDDFFIPVQNRAYSAGNYSYAEVTKTWSRTHTRATLGGYVFTAHVVAPGNQGGGQFAIEQPAGKHLTFAADWYTGNQALGYVTPGVIWKVTSQLTLYGTYQIGNHGAASGNRQMLLELGWNFN